MEINTPEFSTHSQLLYSSYLKTAGVPLINIKKEVDIITSLYEAPFILVSHDTQSDPVFNYANLGAQKLWEYPWHEFITIPSRLSAEPLSQPEREQLLEMVEKIGYINDYEGVRISKSKKRFKILNAFIWNILDENQDFKGQAAMFKTWQYL